MHDAEHIFGAMIDFAHENVLLFLALLAFGNVLNGADHPRGPCLTPDVLEISKPNRRHPPEPAISLKEPVLCHGAFRIDGVERRFAVRPNPFRILRVHPGHPLLDSHLVSDSIENPLTARIPRQHAVARIVMPRSDLCGVQGKLQTILPYQYGLLRLLAQPVDGLSKLGH